MTDAVEPKDKWTEIAKEAFEISTTYVDNNYRAQWENNIRHHKSQHHTGSKYHSDAYRFKSRLFRPKTRAMTRQNEAAAAAAFFSNADAVSIEPFNKKNPMQRASADLRDGLLNYRLQFTLPWFLTCIGGMQDAQVQGVVASKQYWKLKKHDETVVGEDGQEREITVIDEDKPCIDLIPIEYVRYSPSASWVDPINSSPYVIIQTPMYIGDVKEKIEAKEWLPVDDGEWAEALVNDYDTTRQVREGKRTDPQENQHTGELSDFDMVMVHENFVRRGGKEYHFYTLGTLKRLSQVKPLKEVYWHDMRPIALGSTIIETHTNMPAGPVEITAPLQKETNEVSNSRRDNVKLVLNKRYIVKRGAEVDLRSLVRNAAGSITMATNPQEDVNALEFNDVTGSSYEEQDRLNLDYDELAGAFSQSSVGSNRKLGETVGGMAMLRQDAGGMKQYLISVFSETWVEPVLRQLDALEQAYESDLDLLTMISDERNILEKYQIPMITPGLLKQPAKVVINVVNSATDPILKLEQFLLAIERYTAIVGTAPPDMDLSEIRKEIFGKLGYKDGQRFFMEEDSQQGAMIQQLQQQLQQMAQALEDDAAKAQAEQQGKMAIAQLQTAASERETLIKEENENRRHEQEMRMEARKIEANTQAKEKETNKKLIADLAKTQITTKSAEKTAEKTAETAKTQEKPEKEEKQEAGDIYLTIDNTSGRVQKTIDMKKTKSGYQAKVMEEPVKEKK